MRTRGCVELEVGENEAMFSMRTRWEEAKGIDAMKTI